MNGFQPEEVIPLAVVIFFGIGLHEYAHCKLADMAGDPTPRIYGRVTLNLFKHFDPLGTIMMLVTAITGYGIGWGKPAPIDASKMRNPRWDLFVAVAGGPISNILQAIVWAIIGRVLLMQGILQPSSLGEFLQAAAGQGSFRSDAISAGLVYFGVVTNLSLAFFNLIPLGLLDGHWLVGLLMPERARDRWFLWNRQYGSFLLIGLILIGQAQRELSVFRIIGIPIDILGNFFLSPFTQKQ